MKFLKSLISMNEQAECIHSMKTPPLSTIGRQRTHCMSSFHWAQDKCSDIEYDVLNLEKFASET